MRYQGEPFREQPSLFGVSQTKRFLEIQPAGSTGFVAVRFYPWGARRFLRLPVAEFADRHVPGDELFGSACRELLERVADSPSIEERVARVDAFLFERFDASPPDAVDFGVRLIWANPGLLSDARLSRT
jgi:hypothetical protein